MKLQINDTIHEVAAEGDTPLLWILRDNLGMTGTKYGCGIAQCGACSVLVDGVVTRSCVMPVDSVVGRHITTIEAIEADAIGKRVVAAWVKHQVPQCGYCQSGQVIAATALLKQVATPSDEEIEASMINLCRCGTYNAIRAAMHDLAGPASGAQTDTAAPITAPLAAAAGIAAAAAIVMGARTCATQSGQDDAEATGA